MKKRSENDAGESVDDNALTAADMDFSLGTPTQSFAISYRNSVMSFVVGQSFNADVVMRQYMMDNNLPVVWGAQE